jgi:uncharacterized protein YbjQ (UPF0145 family)
MFKWLFGTTSPEELARQKRQQLSLESLQKGGLPIDAKERIEREVARGNSFFSSDLSAQEMSLAHETGVEVIGQVMGSSFYNVSFYGLLQRQQRSTGEMLDLTKAHLDARTLAMGRLQQEAAMLGASGVIGVRIKSNVHSWGNRLTEFTAVGTAVRIPGYTGAPFTSALSAQEFWQLHKAGYLPVGVALGVCSYYMYTDPDTRSMLYGYWNSRNNVEVPLYTQGLQYARETAMDRLTSDIEAHKGEGVVGMEVDFSMEHIEYDSSSRTYHDLIAHVVVFGTAVQYRPDIVEPAPKKGLMMLDLSTRPKGRHGVTRMTMLGESHTQGNQLGHTR